MARRLTLQFADKCRFLGYGGPKQALQHCIDLNMGACAAAEQLQSTYNCVKKYANHYGLKFKGSRT